MTTHARWSSHSHTTAARIDHSQRRRKQRCTSPHQLSLLQAHIKALQHTARVTCMPKVQDRTCTDCALQRQRRTQPLHFAQNAPLLVWWAWIGSICSAVLAAHELDVRHQRICTHRPLSETITTQLPRVLDAEPEAGVIVYGSYIIHTVC